MGRVVVTDPTHTHCTAKQARVSLGWAIGFDSSFSVWVDQESEKQMQKQFHLSCTQAMNVMRRSCFCIRWILTRFGKLPATLNGSQIRDFNVEVFGGGGKLAGFPYGH